jgi:peptidoglycan/xylan/chitin deacetylase (PgdA/CDA1 family)
MFTGECPPFRKDDEKFMSLAQVRVLHRHGWEIGSHSVSHPRFDQISDKDAEWEMIASKNFIEENGMKIPVSFAFPYGHYLYCKDQIRLALRHYRFVRTISNPSTGFINSFPIDSYPPACKEEPWNVYTIHAVKDPTGFKSWLGAIKDEGKSVETFEEIAR